MSELSSPINVQRFVTFVLVLTRISGLVMTAPVFGGSNLPMRIRAFVALSLAVVVSMSFTTTSAVPIANLLQLGVALGGELLMGLVLGLGTLLLFSSVQLAGQLISQLSGLSLADLYNPAFDESIPLFSHLLYLCTLSVFVILGGHRLLIAGLIDTFAVLPPGGHVDLPPFEAVTSLLTQSFSLGMQTAAPTITAQLLATVVLGLISRTLPQLNVLALGFGINSMVTFGMLAVSLGGIVWAFEEHVAGFLDTVSQLFIAS